MTSIGFIIEQRTVQIIRKVILSLLAILVLQGNLLGADPTQTVAQANISEWRQKASEGDAESAHLLGHALLTGDGIKEDPKEAVRWLTVAADKGHAMSQLTLALILDEGGPVPQNKQKAVEYYLKAAEQNIKEAQYNLGLCYSKGEGVAKNFEEAAKWYMKAAENWDPNGQLELGLAYLAGRGVKSNREDAIKWLRRSAYQANADAQFQLGLLSFKDPSQESKDEAVKWLERAVENKHLDAMAYLGGLYARGDGVEKKVTKALDYLSQAAAKGHTRAEFELGLCFLNGEGVPSSDAQALYWFQLAARHGDPDAQVRLAIMMAQGRGAPADKEIATKWFKIAAASGNASAMPALKQWIPEADTNKIILSPTEALPPEISVVLPNTNLLHSPTSPSAAPPFPLNAGPSGDNAQPATSPSSNSIGKVTEPDPLTSPPVGSSNAQTSTVQVSPLNQEAKAMEAPDVPRPPKTGASDTPAPLSIWVLLAVAGPAMILSLVLLVLWSHMKQRLATLETEIREAKSQLKQANENMGALLRIVETRMLPANPAVPANPLTGFEPKARIRETSGEVPSFKVQRPHRRPITPSESTTDSLPERSS